MSIKKEEDPELARRRAEVILKVRGGEITATEGAKILDISRKSYYEWEKRGLEGMLNNLSNRSPGRPALKRDPEKEALQKQVEELEKDLEVQKTASEIRLMMQNVDEPEEKGSPEEGFPFTKKKPVLTRQGQRAARRAEQKEEDRRKR